MLSAILSELVANPLHATLTCPCIMSTPSCLNRVLDTRKGIPITLSLIYMEVARRVGMPMHGVNLPSHFLLRPDSKDLEVFVDAFHGPNPPLHA